jgi:hypothetical protein
VPTNAHASSLNRLKAVQHSSRALPCCVRIHAGTSTPALQLELPRQAPTPTTAPA